MNNTQAQIDQVTKLLKEDDHSPLGQIKSLQIVDDLSYLTAWFLYLRTREMLEDITERYLINGHTWSVENLQFRHELHNEILDIIKKHFDDKIENMDFEPRLETYLRKFNSDERDELRLFLIECFRKVHNDETSFLNLMSFIRKHHISQKFIINLSSDHPLFKDKILEIQDRTISRDEPFHRKDLVINLPAYGIFSGTDVKEEDLAFLSGSELLNIFELGQNLPDILSKSEDDQSSYEEADELSDFDIDNLENILDEEEIHDETESEEPEDDNTEIDEDQYSGYKDDLDYIHEEFLWIEMQKNLKEKESDNFLRDRDDQLEMQRLRRDVIKQKNICHLRLSKSKEKGFTPRLERVSARLKLSEFEKNVLKVLTVDKVFPENGHDLGGSTVEVKELVVLLIDDAKERVRAKKFFLRNAKLTRSGLCKIESSNSLNTNIYDSSVLIDNRLIEFFSGENYDISDYIQGSFLYRSSIQLDKVILPGDIKEKLTTTIQNFPAFIRAKENLKFSEVVEYGNALTMLFVGKSGTGKTMLANAISNFLEKKILVFNFNNYSQTDFVTGTDVFSIIFREARMNDAILFFDESEQILESRIQDLLIEIEKHEGIVIFATNESFSIDEAMRRRINLILNLPEPGPSLRREIWKSHLPEKIKLHDNVDLNTLARRYEINGGLIKNAIFSALFQAVNDDSSGDPLLKMDHLDYGAKDQLHNKLFMTKLHKQKIPLKNLEEVVLPATVLNSINEIINLEKNRKVLLGQWGFEKLLANNNGISVLFHGPPGTGKTLSAEAIAQELGKTLKIINYSQVLSMFVGGTEKALEKLFEEVADYDSVLLFDEADALFTSRTSVTTSNDKYANIETDVLLGLIERHNTFVILTTNYIGNIDQAFYRRMNYTVEFNKPGEEEREQLWRTLVPDQMPIANDVNYSSLAREYEFTGGEIKNVIIKMATSKANLMEGKPVFDQQDFIKHCEEFYLTNQGGGKNIGFRKS